MSRFQRSFSSSLEKEPLEEGKIVKGVVIEINDKNNTVIVRMGSTLGVIRIEDMSWARKPDPDIAYYETRVNKVGEVLKVGDVIQVRVKNKIFDTDRWWLSLEQVPRVQAALLCIESETGNVKVMIGRQRFQREPV